MNDFLQRAMRLLYELEPTMDSSARTKMLNLEMDIRLSEVQPDSKPATGEQLTGIEKHFASKHTF